MTIENDPDKDNNKCSFHCNVLYIAEMNGFWSIFFTDAKSWGAVSRSSDRIFEHGLFWNISPRSILSIAHVFKRFDTPNFSARFWKKKVFYFSKFDRRGHSYFKKSPQISQNKEGFFLELELMHKYNSILNTVINWKPNDAIIDWLW